MNNFQGGEIKVGGSKLVICGGNLLPGCPKSWEEAKVWEKKLNEGLSQYGPFWQFDCGYKLDFDGALLDIDSRFYPPTTGYGPKWDGVFHIRILGENLYEKSFEADTLKQLQEQVEAYYGKVLNKLKELIKKEEFENL